MKEMYLVTTDHLENRIWFRNNDDFTAAMNMVPAVSAWLSVCVLAFILMSSHVHFVLCCNYHRAVAFITEFKRRYSFYFRRRYDVKELLRGNKTDIRPLHQDAEAPERAISYSLMNSVAAKLCQHPSLYPWGSGSAFFNASPLKGVRVDSLSIRERSRILHSKDSFPRDSILGEDGFILPASYIDVGFVERLFRSPSRYGFFLHNSSKAKRRLESTDDLPSFRDQVILSAIPDLCNSMFRKSHSDELKEDELAELLRQLRRRFSMDIAQLARVVGLSYDKVTCLLEGF